MRRRLKTTAMVIISQMLLVALAIAWLVHMVIIAAFGSISFVEDNPFILWGEISASGLILVFAIYVLVTQIKRLGERRNADRVPGTRASDRIADPLPDRRRCSEDIRTPGDGLSNRRITD